MTFSLRGKCSLVPAQVRVQVRVRVRVRVQVQVRELEFGAQVWVRFAEICSQSSINSVAALR
jgi:hypothetical protein